MKFELPTASKERLEALLSYLGDRADDFKQCFDVQSEYCLMYADLMLRGMESRDLEYGERHHIVPFCFYKMEKKNCNRLAKHICSNNMTCLTYQEHTYAHYCAALCGIGAMKGKMATAFMYMYHVSDSIPSDNDVISIISSEDYYTVKKMVPQIAKVEAEGRTHSWEDPLKAKQEYREAHRDEYREYLKVYRETHKDELREYFETNRQEILSKRKCYNAAHKAERNSYSIAYNKPYYDAHRAEIIAQNHEYYLNHKEEKREYDRKRRERLKDELRESRKAYREAHKEEFKVRDKNYYENNKEKIRERSKAYHEANKDEISRRRKQAYNDKVASGYRYRKNPVTGKYEWMFVGVKTEVA